MTDKTENTNHNKSVLLVEFENGKKLLYFSEVNTDIKQVVIYMEHVYPDQPFKIGEVTSGSFEISKTNWCIYKLVYNNKL